MVYYNTELRWMSSDYTLREPDASGSFFAVLLEFIKEHYEGYHFDANCLIWSILVLLIVEISTFKTTACNYMYI